jgi:hypothetical protein
VVVQLGLTAVAATLRGLGAVVSEPNAFIENGGKKLATAVLREGITHGVAQGAIKARGSDRSQLLNGKPSNPGESRPGD